MKSKKIMFGLSLLFLFLLAGISYAVSSVFSELADENVGLVLERYFNQTAVNEKIAHKDEFALIIAGNEYTIEEFENVRTFLSLGDRTVSDQEVIDDFVEKEVVYNEALRRGLEVSETEAKDFALETMRGIIETGGEGLELVTQTAKGYNKSIEEYFLNEETIKGYQKALTMGKLREDVYSGIKVDNNTPVEKRYSMEIEAYDKLVQELKDKAVVEFLLK